LTVLRGAVAADAMKARIDADLRANPFAEFSRIDARLVDPRLARELEEAMANGEARGHTDGYERGYAEGLAAGQAAAAEQLAREMAVTHEREQARADAVMQALTALQAAARELGTREASAMSGVEDLLLGAAYDLATTLLGRELQEIGAPARDAVRRALAMLPEDVTVTLFLHPVDIATIGELTDLSTAHTIRLVPDPNIEPGSCAADAGATHVDASLSAALVRAQEALAP